MKTIGLFVGIVVLAILLANIATIANNSNGLPNIFERLFPEHFVNKEDAAALATMQAPFAAQENAAQPVQLDPAIKYDPLGEHVDLTEKLDIAHLHEGAVSRWLNDAVPEILSFSVAGYPAHEAKLAAIMNPVALAEFRAFLQSSAVLGLMQSRSFVLQSFPTDAPLRRTSGAVDGRYRWVYDVPVNMTFLPEGTRRYEDLPADAYQTEQLTFRIQLGRMAEGGRDGIIIETWEALKRKPVDNAQ